MVAPATRERQRRAIKWGAIVGLPLLAVALVIAFFDWNMMRGPLAHYLSLRTGREVRIDGNLDVALAWTPTVTVHGLHIGNPDWAPKKDMASVDRLTVSFKLLPLFRGRLILPAITVEKPTFDLLRQESGRANWRFGDESKPTRLPVIHSLVLTDGHVTLADAQRKMTLVGAVSSREGAAAGKGRPFSLQGNGTLNRRPFLLRVEGDPLLNVDASKPYNFDADIRDGATHVSAHGAITRPFDLGRLNATVTLSGRDLADVYYLTGLALPNTPSYRLSARLTRDEENYTLRNIAGVVGHSDLEGTLSVDASGERPFVRGSLVSKAVDFVDLGALLGARVSRGSHASAVALPANQPPASDGYARVLPDAPLQVNRVRSMDADVRYKAMTIKSEDLPLRALDLHLTLDHGVLTMDPVLVGLVRGKIAGRARIDARKDIPAVSTDVTLSAVRLEEFFPAQGGNPPPLVGEVVARAKLEGRGLSVHRAVSNANGNVTVVVPHGEIRQAFAELLGIDVATGLGLLWTGNQTKTDIRCAVANFRAQNGVMRAENVVFDTGVVLATGTGTVNLDTEALDLRLEGHPKELRLLRVMAPITLKGHLSHAAVGVDASKALAQAGIAGALGALLSPLASILPFVSPGLAKDADCVSLMAEAQSGGVAVKPSATTPATTK